MALSVDGKVRILNRATAAGTTGAGASTDMTEGGIMAVEAYGTTSSGTGSAIIEIQVSNNNSTWQTAGTINLNLGITQTSSRFEMDASWMGWPYVRAKLASISGTGASVSAYKTTGVGDVLTSERDVETVSPATTTAWLFAHPTTYTSLRQYGERQIYVPLDDGFYYGMFFSTKLATYMVPSISDICIAKPAWHKWHGSCTKVGTWTTSPSTIAAGAFQATGVSYSQTAGDTISVSVSGPIVAIRAFNTSNGGFGIVAINGDFTRATRLPAFTAEDYAGGFCRETDIGKRYICGYSNYAQSESMVIADDLDSGAHTILVEATGTKPTASSGTRCYVEGIASVNGSGIGTADVHMVPVNYVLHERAVSAQCYVPSWAPIGSSDFQFMGENHSDNTNSKEITTSFVVYVDATDQTSLVAGTYASGTSITIRHVSTLAHKSAIGTPVATKNRLYTFMAGRKHPAMCDVAITWNSDGILHIEYPVMITVGELTVNSIETIHRRQFHTGEISGNIFPLLDVNGNATQYFRGAGSRLFCYGDHLIAWAAVEDGTYGKNQMFSGFAGMYQDRDTLDEKLYTVSSNGDQFVPNGEVRRFLLGWGAHRI